MQLSYSEYSVLNYESNRLRALDKEIAETLEALAGESVDLNDVSESLISVYSDAVEENIRELLTKFRDSYGVEFDVARLNSINSSSGKGKMKGASYHYIYAQWFFDTLENLKSIHISSLVNGAEMPDFITLVDDVEEICYQHTLSNRIKYYSIPKKLRMRAKYAHLARCSLPYGAVNSKAVDYVCRNYFNELPKNGVDSKCIRFDIDPTAMAAGRCAEYLNTLVRDDEHRMSYDSLSEAVEAIKALQRISLGRIAAGKALSRKNAEHEQNMIIYLREKVISKCGEDRFYELYDAPVERYVTLGGTVIDDFEHRTENLTDKIKAIIDSISK